jgi:hypothetical protein
VKTKAVFHRASEELVSLLERLQAALSKESGVNLTKSQIVELAIRSLAKARHVK